MQNDFLTVSVRTELASTRTRSAGKLTRKIQRHPATFVIMPPMIGPTASWWRERQLRASATMPRLALESERAGPFFAREIVGYDASDAVKSSAP
jgi:hypothetical protein